MTLSQLLDQRSSYYHYDASEILSEEVITQLITEATKAPSAYHLQNWHFIAVTSDHYKQALYEVSYQQAKIKAAPVTFIVCGDMSGHQKIAEALQPSLASGHIPAPMAASLKQGVEQSHTNDAILRRDEAIRSASLASMVLMLAAEDMGYATGAMSGFEADRLQHAFALPDSLIPVMLVTVGSPTTERYPQKKRLPVESRLAIL